MASSSPKAERLYLLDIVRLLSMLAISIFHFLEVFYFEDVVTARLQNSAMSPVFAYARALSFSGFTIVILSSFLFGLSNRKSYAFIYGIFAVGLLSVALTYSNLSGSIWNWEWDIYQYLIVGFAPILFGIYTKSSPRYFDRLAIVGLLIFFVPFWEWQPATKSAWLTPLIGNCKSDIGVGWPLLPWVSLIWAPFGCGRKIRQDAKIRDRLKTMQTQELLAWIVTLTLGIPFLGRYYATPIGQGFSCHMFQQPIYVLLAHLMWVFFAIRLSFLASINARLAQHKVFSFISNLEWSKNFGFCYLIHLPTIYILSIGDEYLAQHPPLVLALLFLIFFIPEIVSKFAKRLQKMVAR